MAAALALSLPVVAASGASAAPPPPLFTYATMSDGAKIAMVVTYPAGFRAGTKWPALFKMDGYEGGAGAEDPAEWGNHYVVIHASIRGTGCSGGRFDLTRAPGVQGVERPR